MTAADAQSRPRSAGWRAIAAGPAVALSILVWAIVATDSVGLPVRDPDNVAAQYLVLVGTGVALLVLIDIVIRAGRRAGRFFPPRSEIAAVRRERWTRGRIFAAGAALTSFYVSYMAYRNLKSIVPLVRPRELFDRQLAELDRDLFAGTDPATLLHALLGTGLTTHVLSAFYIAWIVLLPLTIGVALVFARNLEAGMYYTTAQSINWILGAASYFVLPALGPIYYEPSTFAELPHSEVTRLQGLLMDQRVAFLQDPSTATPQAIAAFASLHISMSFTAVIAAHLLGFGRRVTISLWAWFAITMVGTVYLGWHYVVDNVAGVAMGAAALFLAGVITGIDLRRARTRADLVPVRDNAPVIS